jgi:hypothetical protein
MISNRFLIAGLYAVALVLAVLVATDDGMATCLSHHSFDVCHDSLH